MDTTTLAWLQAEGAALLAELAERDLRDATLLPEIERLRARHRPEQARAAIEQALLRRKAQAKFSRAAEMFFTREALEQATAEPVAQHRAARIARAGVAHLVEVGCGIGGDALALAAAGVRVTAFERDPLRAALATANAQALGLADRIAVRAEELADDPPPADALFCDPARRDERRRVFDVAQYQPPLPQVLAWRGRIPALCVKLGPGVPYDSIPGLDGCEVEAVSLGGDMKELVLWCGALAQQPRRATVLPAGAVLLPAPQPPEVPLADPAAYLYEPDAAVIRAHLVRELAAQLGASQLDAQIAYLTSDHLVATPLARAWRVLEWQPFQLKRLRARLRDLGAGPVTVKKRGSPLDTDALARQLSGDGPRPLVVVLTQGRGQPITLICEQLA